MNLYPFGRSDDDHATWMAKACSAHLHWTGTTGKRPDPFFQTRQRLNLHALLNQHPCPLY